MVQNTANLVANRFTNLLLRVLARQAVPSGFRVTQVEISFFFRPVDTDALRNPAPGPQRLGSMTDVHDTAFPDWMQADVVLLGCAEDRASATLRGSAAAPNRIRDYLYPLAAPHPGLRLADLGNLAPKDDIDEYYEALAYVMGVLLRADKTVILLGGTQDIAYGQYRGYESLETYVEYVSVDARPDMLDAEVALTSHSHNSAVFMHAPNYLYHFICLGAQGHYVTETERKTLKAMNFEFVRLGELTGNVRAAEPYLRNAHMVSFDVSAVRQADAPGTTQPGPAGFTTEQACQVARYAGMGYRTSSFSICEVLPDTDPGEQTAHLAALLAWYFLDGYYHRIPDAPRADRSNLQVYRAALHGTLGEITFYRSPATDRWWMEVPSPQAMRNNERVPGQPSRGLTTLVPCAEADYQAALRNEIPERWWMAHYRYR